MISIRQETAEDIVAIRLVHERAFGQPQEAGIVDRLRAGCPGLLSLVAVRERQVVGHVLFSPVNAEGEGRPIQGMGLAPMAVLPEHQRQGNGTKLVEAGLALLRERSCPFVVVVGHPPYYPRFGFEPASRRGLRSQWDGIPDEAFMVLVLDEAAMGGASGVARYRAEFDEAG